MSIVRLKRCSSCGITNGFKKIKFVKCGKLFFCSPDCYEVYGKAMGWFK